jgi:hypothetical protein
VLADPLGDVVVREPELFRQPLQTARFLDGIEVGALQVLDKTEHELLIAACVGAHDGRHAGEPGNARGAPAALAGDELVTVEMPAQEQWLQETVLADRLRQLSQWLRVETSAHLHVRRADLVDRDHLRHHRAPVARHRDERFQTATEAAKS